MIKTLLAAAALTACLVAPALAADNDPYGDQPAPDAMMLPHSPMPADEAALALPEPETEAIAPYANHGCRGKGETVYLTN